MPTLACIHVWLPCSAELGSKSYVILEQFGVCIDVSDITFQLHDYSQLYVRFGRWASQTQEGHHPVLLRLSASTAEGDASAAFLTQVVLELMVLRLRTIAAALDQHVVSSLAGAGCHPMPSRLQL